MGKKIQEQHDEICILTEKNAKLESAKKQLQKQSFRQNKEIMSWKISDEKKNEEILTLKRIVKKKNAIIARKSKLKKIHSPVKTKIPPSNNSKAKNYSGRRTLSKIARPRASLSNSFNSMTDTVPPIIQSEIAPQIIKEEITTPVLARSASLSSSFMHKIEAIENDI